MSLGRIASVVAVLWAAWGAGPQPARAQQTPSDAARQLIEQEWVRAQLDEALAHYGQPAESGDVRTQNLVDAVDRVVGLGPSVVPLLVDELTQGLPGTFFFAAYGLGRLGTAEADAALRDAVAQADRDTTDFGITRKGWACFALALMGREDSVDLLNQGLRRAAGVPIHRGMSALEAAAVHTAPGSVPRLHAQLERYTDEDDPQFSERVLVLKALGRVADPASLPALSGVLTEAHPGLRKYAAYAIADIPGEASRARLVAALDDADLRVRRAAARGLLETVPVVAAEVPLARLDVESDPLLRASLYELVGRAGGAEAVPRLAAHWGRSDPWDRGRLARALGRSGSEAALPVLTEALHDSDTQVAVDAVLALADLGTDKAIALLIDAVRSPFWSVAQTAIEQLGRLGDARAAPALAARLIEVELSEVVVDPHRRARADKLAEALGRMPVVVRLEQLREAAARQTDPPLVATMDRLLRRLENERRNGRKARKWIATLDSDDPVARGAAYAALGRLGGQPAARALAAAFERVPPAEGREILRALGSIGGATARQHISDVLLDPAFDSIEHSALRDMAAWSARRIGGEPMFDLLRQAVDRRSGRDWAPLVYLAVLGGERALPTLERLRLERMHYLRWSRGLELEALDEMRRELSAGRSLTTLDVPPERLTLR